MKLSKPDADLFFRLTWALHFFVNRKMNIYSRIKNVRYYQRRCDDKKKAKVRQALYENKNLIDSFVEENPDDFSKEDLSIVSGWKDFIWGDFYIERFLKKQTIFIQDGNVYGVLGLHQSFNELIHRSNLPLYVNAILLPFKGKIIYDGFLGMHNLYFGSGVKGRLKETYLRAKQNHRIIERFQTDPAAEQKKPAAKPLKDWKPELDDVAAKVKKWRGSAGQPAIYTPAFSLVKASVEFARLAVSETDEMEALYAALKKINRALKKTAAVLDREE